MTINWKNFTLNNVGEAENWSPVEVAFHKNLIDTTVADCCSALMDTAGHKHKTLYSTGGTITALSTDASGNSFVADDLQFRFGNVIATPDAYIEWDTATAINELRLQVTGTTGTAIRLKTTADTGSIILESKWGTTTLSDTSFVVATDTSTTMFTVDDNGLFLHEATYVAQDKQIIFSSSFGNRTANAYMELDTATTPDELRIEMSDEAKNIRIKAAASSNQIILEGENSTTLTVKNGFVTVAAAYGFTLPVKTDTGDPGSAEEGTMYVNTFDNKVRVYADGSWQDVCSW